MKIYQYIHCIVPVCTFLSIKNKCFATNEAFLNELPTMPFFVIFDLNEKQGIYMLKTKTPLSKITPQYIIDKAGKKTGVILDILAFEQLLEEIEDIYFGAKAHKALQENDEFIAHADVKKKIARKR